MGRILRVFGGNWFAGIVRHREIRLMNWLTRPLVCSGDVVLDGLAPEQIVDADLHDICLRMHAIFDTIEMARCEGRLMPRNLFDDIDRLEGILLHGHRSRDGHSSPPRLSEWVGVIREFGRYYGLDGEGPIVINADIYRELSERYG